MYAPSVTFRSRVSDEYSYDAYHYDTQTTQTVVLQLLFARECLNITTYKIDTVRSLILACEYILKLIILSDKASLRFEAINNLLAV